MSTHAIRADEDMANREIEFGGEALVLDHSGALMLVSERVLVVADMHLEKGSRLAARGMLVPPYDTPATLARLARLVARHRPRLIVSLGDGFDDDGGGERMSRPDLAALDALAAGRDLVWIAGNHDPAPPHVAAGRAVRDLRVGGLLLRHEPDPDAGAPQIAGHLHPAAIVRLRGQSVRRKAFASDGRLLVMPAFGAYSGGVDIMSASFRRVLDPRALVAYCLGDRRIYTVDARVLG